MSMMADTPAEQHIIDVGPDKRCLKRKFIDAAFFGDWKIAKAMLEEHPEEITPSTRLGFNQETALQIATREGHLEFVEKLVEMMDKEDLCIPDAAGDTALSFAAQYGLTEIASILLNKKPDLAITLVVKYWMGNNFLPIQIAALHRQSRMVSLLYEVTKNQLEERDHIDLFSSLIHLGYYDIAKKMLSENPGLATQRNNKGKTALYTIARHVPETTSTFAQLARINELIQELLEQANGRPDLIKEALFVAAREGNSVFVRRALGLYPDQTIELDDNNHSLFHVAVQHRRADVFQIMDMSSIKLMTDRERNSLLDLTAKLPLSGLEVVPGPGAALQLQRELFWFKEVKKVCGMLLGDPKNIERYVLLFEKEHEELRCKAEKWLTNTANSGMPVAILVFSAGIAGLFSVPGGYKQDTGVPIHLGNFWFKTYRISYAATSLFSFSAIIIFLSILISGFPMKDFLKSLPSKLLFGILSLFVSIVALMTTVVAAFYLHFEHPIPRSSYPVAAVAFVLILLASYLLLPLPVQVFRSTFMPLKFRRNRFLIC